MYSDTASPRCTDCASVRKVTRSCALATGSSVVKGFACAKRRSRRPSSSAEGYPSANRIRKRSSCASGKGKVPSCSMGFCVAITKKGSASGRVSPSVVTCRSSMHSSRAACVRGVARFISSAKSTFVNAGPLRNSNCAVASLNTLTPVTSEGNRSGVNCTRLKSS